MECVICGKLTKNPKSKTCCLNHFNQAMKLGLVENGKTGWKWDDEFKANMSRIQKGREKSEKERKELSERMSGSNHYNFGIKYSDELCEKLSVSQKQRWANYTPEEREVAKNAVIKNSEKGGICKWFSVDGILLQGRYELFYILNLKENNLKLPISHPTWLNTPYGNYQPDFEFENYYLEIKSAYTFQRKENKNQIKKINWVSKNIKKVIVKIFNNKEVDSFLKNYNIDDYRHSLL